MNFLPGDPVWAHSDGTNVARGWHRGVVTGTRVDWVLVELLEYGREFRTRADRNSLRPRDEGGNDTNLPTSWVYVPWRPAENWKPKERAGT